MTTRRDPNRFWIIVLGTVLSGVILGGGGTIVAHGERISKNEAKVDNVSDDLRAIRASLDELKSILIKNGRGNEDER